MAKTISLQYISSFCLYLQLALESGLQVTEGVRLFAEEERDPALRDMEMKIYESAVGGASIGQALTDCGKFPAYMTEMVTAGERTGNLDRVLRALSRYYDGQEQLRRSVRSAVLYPAVLLAMVLCVLVVFLVAVLPIFQEVYSELGVQMSAFALGLMNVGAWLRGYWYIPLAVAAVLVALFILHSASVRKKGGTTPLLALFGGRRLAASMASGRFADALYLGVSSGMDTDQSLEMASRLISDPEMSGRAQRCLAEVRSGTGFADALVNSGLFPPLYGRMIAMGVRTGTADTVVAEVARRTSEQTEDMLSSIVSKIEPTLVIIMSVLIGAVLLSVMLPLAGIMSAI